MEKVLRVGKMPGRITEVVVEVGTSIKEVLELAELDATGFEIKVDGNTATLDTKVTENTNLVILAQQVKGNSEKIVRVGKMPGRIQEILVQPGMKIREVLAMAELDATGFEVKVDGQQSSLDATVTENTNLIILAAQVKGNK